jgi:hypothetical protein
LDLLNLQQQLTNFFGHLIIDPFIGETAQNYTAFDGLKTSNL